MAVLETERLLFRDHRPEDLEPYCSMEADPEVRRYVGGRPRPHPEAVAKFHSVHLGAPGRLKLWATVFKPERRYIGYCGIYPHFGPAGAIPGEGTLAFYLARPYWGRGLATEAGRAFVEFGFGELQLTRIVASAQEGNGASVHVLRQLGFAQIGRERSGERTFVEFELTSDRRAALSTSDGG